MCWDNPSHKRNGNYLAFSIPIGPKDTAEIGTYTSVTEFKGTRVLWYPDRKFLLLGKYIDDEFLE